MRIASRALVLTAHLFFGCAYAQSLAVGAIEAHLVGTLREPTIAEVRRARSAVAPQSVTAQLEVPAITAPPSNLLLNRIIRTSWVVFAYDVNTGSVVPNVNMTLSQLRHEPNSGGHDHDSSQRPKGAISAFGGNTGPTGMDLILQYTSPEVSGIVYSDAACTGPNGFTCHAGSYYSFTTKWAGLLDLGPGAAYDLTGTRPEHTSNHWGTSSFLAKLREAAVLYNLKYAGKTQPKLGINDISLQFGGLFDLDANWAPPHKEHRIGVVADLRSVPASRITELHLILKAVGITGPNLVHGPPNPHWHVREFRTRE